MTQYKNLVITDANTNVFIRLATPLEIKTKQIALFLVKQDDNVKKSVNDYCDSIKLTRYLWRDLCTIQITTLGDISSIELSFLSSLLVPNRLFLVGDNYEYQRICTPLELFNRNEKLGYKCVAPTEKVQEIVQELKNLLENILINYKYKHYEGLVFQICSIKDYTYLIVRNNSPQCSCIEFHFNPFIISPDTYQFIRVASDAETLIGIDGSREAIVQTKDLDTIIEDVCKLKQKVKFFNI